MTHSRATVVPRVTVVRDVDSGIVLVTVLRNTGAPGVLGLTLEEARSARDQLAAIVPDEPRAIDLTMDPPLEQD